MWKDMKSASVKSLSAAMVTSRSMDTPDAHLAPDTHLEPKAVSPLDGGGDEHGWLLDDVLFDRH